MKGILQMDRAFSNLQSERTDWKTSQLKHIFQEINEKLDHKPEDVPFIGLENIEPWNGRLTKADFTDEVSSGVVAFKANDVLFGKLRPYLAKAYLADFDGVATTEVLVLRPGELCEGRYLLYLLLSDPFIRTVDAMTYGVKMPRANVEQIGSIVVSVPPIHEQNLIVAFLDREVKQIDDLIAAKERLLHVLGEKRQTIVAQCVTRGLNLHTTLKETGLSWCRHIPSHWSIVKIKYVARLESGHTPSRQHPEWWENCTIPWFTLADVWQIRDDRQEYLNDTSEQVSELGLANSSARLLPAGTVVLSRTASVGFSGIMAVPMATSQDFFNWVCSARLVPEYLLYVLRSMRPYLLGLMSGSTHQTIYLPDAEGLSTLLPPVNEQREIVDYIRVQTAAITRLEDNLRASIRSSKERRISLVASAISGQLNLDTIQ